MKTIIRKARYENIKTGQVNIFDTYDELIEYLGFEPEYYQEREYEMASTVHIITHYR